MIGYIFISHDNYKGVSVRKYKRIFDGAFRYYAYGVWFEDFRDFMEAVDDAEFVELEEMLS